MGEGNRIKKPTAISTGCVFGYLFNACISGAILARMYAGEEQGPCLSGLFTDSQHLELYLAQSGQSRDMFNVK